MMLKTFAVLRTISEPFNAGRTVEVKLGFDPLYFAEGEIYWRIPASRAHEFKIDSTYTITVEKVKG